MNTNDIRNMRLNQWVFWAVALPLASVVITLCLLWAGELANFRRGFVGLWGRGRAGDARGGGGGLVDARETDHRRARRLEAEIAGLEAEREFVGRQMRRERSDLYGNRRYDYV